MKTWYKVHEKVIYYAGTKRSKWTEEDVMRKRIMAFILSAALLVPNAGLLERKVSAAGASVAVNEANFPDDAFRDYVAKNFDKDSNGVLSETEIEGVTTIDIESEDVESLKGIEYFPGVTDLFCNDNKITELDLSKNTALQYVECESNRLTKINVNGCSKLSGLFCNDNFLTSLDLRPCKNLVLAICHRNNLTSVNITGLSQLSDANFSENMLTALDVSSCTKLQALNAAYNQLESLDVSENGCERIIKTADSGMQQQLYEGA